MNCANGCYVTADVMMDSGQFLCLSCASRTPGRFVLLSRDVYEPAITRFAKPRPYVSKRGINLQAAILKAMAGAI